MTNISDLISEDNAVFSAYCFWSSVLVLKMLTMSFLTGRLRHSKAAFANPEDAAMKNAKVKQDSEVERVRRAHRNDLENILPFFAIGFIYVLTNPDPTIAVNLFRAFALARIAHTVVYAVCVVRQPARAIAWFVGLSCTIYMAVKCFTFFCNCSKNVA